MMNENKKPIPVTIVTGFLGAGKTTFLNKLLKKNQKKKFLIIENEAGNINIDGGLIDKKENVLIELTNGCICCSLNSELGSLLNSLILSNTWYDNIIIEATGMADPSEIIQLFMGNRAQQYFRLDAVIGLVDAGLFSSQFEKFTEIRRQIAQSDIILINKTDCVEEQVLTDLTNQIHAINPFAELHKTQYAETGEIKMIDSFSYKPGKIEKKISDFSSFKPAVSANNSHGINTFGFSIEGKLNVEKFSFWLEDFIYTNAENLLRIKGVLNVPDMKHKIILQSVSGHFQVLNGSEWNKTEPRINQLVFIGTDLNREEIEKSLFEFIN
ncbi:CobW family GTP-binding protein [Natronoflexus pectinivorans]|uniref:G3E family GTPase n=1 Tax=Natronoflexus pectinivorans TaxID=682526 RepID=A0A4R2GDC0_9BACT|nr:GTP-binding protein [Natronoflexus pectinivorans]TCO06036.1 G3E family GTPase [Natronoflexus pectinivorans]